MCGIAGFLNGRNALDQDAMYAAASAMAGTLFHRGPDDCGAWADASAGVALGHTRLSIIDLSACGHQPMQSQSGRFTTVYNGEIYNHAELRRELESRGYTFQGHSDTSVLLAAVAEWGVTQAVSRLIGMFAFAVWDDREQTLTAVRDRLGIKPLYYGQFGATFLFGSELKALRAHKDFRGDIDRGAVALFMRHNYVPAPYTIYRGVYKLPPGTLLTIRTGQTELSRPTPYWNLSEVAASGLQQPFRGSEEEAVAELDQLLSDAVRLRMVADVPLGAFLSGGIDSSTVTALMQKQSSQPVKTFCIGFQEEGYNEADYAKAVAKHLGTDHTEQYVSPAEAQQVIPRLPEMYDEPFADSSQIPTFLVSQLARHHVTVSLSGDGGDELFGGYTRYLAIDRYWRRISRIPLTMRQLAAKAVYAIGGRKLQDGLTAKMARRADFLSMPDAASAYRMLNIHWSDREQLVLGADAPQTVFSDPAAWPPRSDVTEQWMYVDTLSYLPDDILVKVDRASMAVGLEARVPILDHRVVEFAWSLPLRYRIRGGQGKWLLRRVLDKYVPQHLIDRPKVGFGVPIDSWLRCPLRDWAESLISEDRLRREGYLRPEPVRRKWEQHLSGRSNWHYHLWDVLMFQAWLDSVR